MNARTYPAPCVGQLYAQVLTLRAQSLPRHVPGRRRTDDEEERDDEDKDSDDSLTTKRRELHLERMFSTSGRYKDDELIGKTFK